MKKMKKILSMLLIFSFIVGNFNAVRSKAATYTYKTLKIEDVGEYNLAIAANQGARFQFTPKETGVYLIYGKSALENSANDTIGIGFEADSVRSENYDRHVIVSAYYAKGKTYSIYVRLGERDKKADIHYKNSDIVSLQIKKAENRVQELTTSKSITFKSQDAKEISVPMVDDVMMYDETFASLTHSGDIFYTFTPKKTGYYRFYYPYYYGLKSNCTQLRVDFYDEKYRLKQYQSQDAIKLKKGVKYTFALDAWLASKKTTVKVQYLSSVRYIKLDYNLPEGYTLTQRYAVKKGKKLGLLLNLPEFNGNGYKFVGWYTKKKGGKKITATTKKQNKTKRLYAHWKKK